MTLIQMADSIYRLSMGHVLNGEKHTKEGFRYWFERMFFLNDRKNVLFSMVLPDGEWLCIATHYDDGYDYYVPDTREQEADLLKRFLRM